MNSFSQSFRKYDFGEVIDYKKYFLLYSIKMVSKYLQVKCECVHDKQCH